MRPAITHFSQHSIQFKSDNKLFFLPATSEAHSQLVLRLLLLFLRLFVCLLCLQISCQTYCAAVTSLSNIMSDLLCCSDIIIKYHVRPTALQ